MTALLVLFFAAGMDVVCGWQPMPDGTASYECVVQIEPELASTLGRGDSIPLSVEVPEHVQPIRRIRIVAGHGQVPQQTLAADFRTWPPSEREPRDGIVETQYVVPSSAVGDRYAAPQNPQEILPPSGSANAPQNAVNQQLQNAGQSVRNAVSEAAGDILPPDSGRTLSNAVQGTGQQLGNDLRNLGNTTREDIRQLFGTATADTSQGNQILPPGGAASDTSTRSGQSTQPLSGNTASTNRRRVDQPIPSGQAGNWQSGGQSATSRQQPSSTFNDNRTAADNRTATTSAPPFQSNSQNIVPPPTQSNNNAFSGNSTRGMEVADSRTGVDQGSTAGPSFPPFTSTTTGGLDTSPVTPNHTRTNSSSDSPTIYRNSLSQPIDAGMSEAATPQNTQTPANTAPNNQQTDQRTGFGWNLDSAAQQPSQQSPEMQSGAIRAETMPLLLSWVLLSGSGAGNLYLIWSYLDVRNKYRDLIEDVSDRITRRRREA